jgi:hypothetical protein
LFTALLRHGDAIDGRDSMIDGAQPAVLLVVSAARAALWALL